MLGHTTAGDTVLDLCADATRAVGDLAWLPEFGGREKSSLLSPPFAVPAPN